MIYIILFILFLTLNGMFSNRIIDKVLNKKINSVLQILLIVIFLFGGQNIINTDDASCTQSPYATIGRVDYFIEEPYVKFIDCYGHKSKSKRKNPELLGKAKNESVQIYYNHDTKDYYHNEDINIYRVYTSKEAYEKGKEIPLQRYFGFLMLFIFIYTHLAKKKKLYVPSSLRANISKIYHYKREHKSFSKLLQIIDKEYYELGDYEEYFLNPIVFTNESNEIVIERFKLFNVLLPGVVSLGLLWAFFRTFGIYFDTMATFDEKGIVSDIGLFGIIFLYITAINILAKRRVGLFDISSKKYTSYLENKTIIFDDIYAYTITWKKVWSHDMESKIELYELDMVLNSGKVVNLYARNNSNTILQEAKVIATYTNKPIYNFAKKDINKI